MKKRIVCLVLSLVMLVSLIPTAVITASAAGASAVSEAGIRVIKDYMGFRKNAYEVEKGKGVYKIGYGTPSVAGATITEANADQYLREELKKLEGVVSSAVSAPLVQKRFDALVWYSYTQGTGWTGDAGFVNAVNSGVTGSAFADVMGSWDYDRDGYPDDAASKGVLTRRMAMINLYLNGVYSSANTGSFSFTVFDAGEGAVFPNGKRKMVQVFNGSTMTKINVAEPALAGGKFLGWYIGSAMITGVGSSTAGQTLLAHWQAGDDKVAAKYTLPGYVIYEASKTADNAYVTVYDDPMTLNKIDVVQRDAVVTIVAEKIVSGQKWLELATGGWVKLCDSLNDVPTIISGRTVTITDDYVNIRKEPNVVAAKLGQAKRGETRTIYMLSTDGKWGYCSEGWLFLAYTDYTGTADGSGSGALLGEGIPGIVTGAQSVNVRSAAGVGNPLVTKLPEGTAIKVYEQTTVNNAAWGHIDQGWISMGYVKLSQTVQTGSSVTTGSSAVVSSSVSLNVRSGPGTGYTKVAALTPGTSVVILQKRTVGGVAWGLIDQGWINLNYVTAGITSSGTGTGASGYGVGGTVVNCATGVNIRSAAGTTNALVGVAPLGSRVTVTERVQVNGFYWGHIERGWVCMDYIKLDHDFTDPVNNGQGLDNVVTTFEGYPATTVAAANVRESASADARSLLTLEAGVDVNILARAQTGENQYGKISVGSVTGWVNMSDVRLTPVNAKVTAARADAYELPNVRSKFFASLVQGTYVTIGHADGSGWELSDGTLWGQIDLNGQSAWIKLSDVTQFRGNQMPTGVTTLSGVGYMTGSVVSETPIYKDSNGNVDTAQTIYTVVAGHRVNIQARNFVSGTTYGKITVGSVTGWIPMTSVALDPVQMQATANVPAWTAEPGSAQDFSNWTIYTASKITVLDRLIVPDSNEINHGIADIGKVYVGDNPGIFYWVRLDQGKLQNISAATGVDTSNPSVVAGVVVTGTAPAALSVYEEALAGSRELLKLNAGSNVTILNWKLVEGKTWGKVQAGQIVGWVDVSLVDFSGLKGTIAVNDLYLYSSADKLSSVQVLRVNNRAVEINPAITFDGTTLWGYITVGDKTGWIDLAGVSLSTPGAVYDPTPKTVIATGTINSVNATINVNGEIKTLPKGSAVNLTKVEMSGGKALWTIDMGGIGGTIDMECLKMNTAIATVNSPSIDIYDDLASMGRLYTLYRDETITVLTFKCWTDGALYGEVAYGNTTGWIRICDASGAMQVLLKPGSTGTTIGAVTPTTPTNPTTPTAEPIPGYIVCANTVNVRNGAGVQNTLVTTLPNGKTVNIYEQTTVLGKGWARIDEGWVCMDYVRLGTLATGGAGTGTAGSAPVIVTTVPSGAIAVGYANEDVTIRSGSGLGYPEVATLKKGNSITIYEKKLDGGMSWGRTDNGWICISYLTITGIGASGSGNSGTIARCGFTANVRSNANSGSALMAKVMISSRVVVHETTVVGSETWGRTDLGWISMQYIVMDSEAAPVPTPADPGAAINPSDAATLPTDGFVG